MCDKVCGAGKLISVNNFYSLKFHKLIQMKMQQAPSTLAATATEAIEEDASLPEETENNIAKMVHSNSEDKENPTQPSSQIKQKGSSKKKNEKFADENSAKAIISAFGSACAPPGAFS